MHRTVPHAGARVYAALALTLVLSSPAAALPLISEVFYDAVGSDTGQSFVELYGTPGTDLTGFTIEGINGSNGAVTDSVALSGLISADGFFVLADDQGDGTTLADDQGDGTTLLENADLIGRFDFQNGPDSFVSRNSARVQGWRKTFIHVGLREEGDSVEVQSDPLISSP
jgi:hypothetical protein